MGARRRGESFEIDPSLFPSLPGGEGTPGDGAVLGVLKQGHTGLAAFYEALHGAVGGEAKPLVHLLRLDWKRRLEHLLPRIDATLGGREAKHLEARPSAAAAGEVAAKLGRLGLAEVLGGALQVARGCCLGLRLVPWSAQSTGAELVFRDAVEAEDEHLGQIEWMRDLLRGG